MPKAIVLFDRECIFCNSFVLYFIKYDKWDDILFVSQQIDIGIKLMKENNCFFNALNTKIIIKGNKVSVKTEAITKIGQLLSAYPELIVLLKLIPQLIRDHGYDVFSKRRYRLFGKRNNCLLPTQDVRKKFIN